MPAICWECGQDGHLRAHCPQVSCRQCGRRGHLERVCTAASASTRQRDKYRRRDKATSNNTRSSNPHCLPWNWTLCARYRGSFGHAIAGLGKEGRKYAMEEVRKEEFEAIEDLVQRTWDGRRVGIGVDGANLYHSSIKVVNIERIENPGTYEKYSRGKQTMLQTPRSQRDSTYPPVENIPGGSRPIWTKSAIKNDSFLWGNFFPPINEYYLFHGTKEGNVMSIAEEGFNMDYSLDRGLMGAGIYFAESSTKADMYADLRHIRKMGDKHMFLVRVLMGSMYVNTLKTKLHLQHPPCLHCLEHDCDCDNPEYFDSVVDDSHRLFRIFAVYSSDQCYPEYLITYRRVHDDDDDDEEDEEEYSDDEDEHYYNQDVQEEDAEYVSVRFASHKPENNRVVSNSWCTVETLTVQPSTRPAVVLKEPLTLSNSPGLLRTSMSGSLATGSSRVSAQSADEQKKTHINTLPPTGSPPFASERRPDDDIKLPTKTVHPRALGKLFSTSEGMPWCPPIDDPSEDYTAAAVFSSINPSMPYDGFSVTPTVSGSFGVKEEPPVTTQTAAATRITPYLPPPIVLRPPSPVVRHESQSSPVTSYYAHLEAYNPGIWYPGSGLDVRRPEGVVKQEAGCCHCFPCLPCQLPPEDCCVNIPDDEFRTPGKCGILRCSSKALKVLAIILCGLLLLGGAANPIAMFSYGRLHAGGCPVSREITTYLQALGLCAFLLHLVCSALMFDKTMLPTNCGFGLSVALVFIANLGLQIFGFVIVYPYKGDYNTTDPVSSNYCSEEVYTFAFVTTTLQTILFVLCPVSGCLLHALNKTVFKVVTGFFFGLGVLVVGLIFLFAVALPIALVVVGALKLDSCPWLPFLPKVALGAGGALLLCFLGLVICACCCRLDKTKKRLNVWRTAVVFYFLILVTLQVLGYLYVYPYKADTLSLDPSSAGYCDNTLYQLAYTASTFICLLYLVVPGLLCTSQV